MVQYILIKIRTKLAILWPILNPWVHFIHLHPTPPRTDYWQIHTDSHWLDGQYTWYSNCVKQDKNGQDGRTVWCYKLWQYCVCDYRLYHYINISHICCETLFLYILCIRIGIAAFRDPSQLFYQSHYHYVALQEINKLPMIWSYSSSGSVQAYNYDIDMNSIKYGHWLLTSVLVMSRYVEGNTGLPHLGGSTV